MFLKVCNRFASLSFDWKQNSREATDVPAALLERFIQTSDRGQTHMYKWFKINSLVKTSSGEYTSTVIGSVKLNLFFILHPMSTERVFFSPPAWFRKGNTRQIEILTKKKSSREVIRTLWGKKSNFLIHNHAMVSHFFFTHFSFHTRIKSTLSCYDRKYTRHFCFCVYQTLTGHRSGPENCMAEEICWRTSERTFSVSMILN